MNAVTRVQAELQQKLRAIEHKVNIVQRSFPKRDRGEQGLHGEAGPKGEIGNKTD